ncbi:MAG: DUF2061 domain-containing protein [Planctomycetota bacterium]
MESKRRSIAKTCSWRFLATIITMCVAYFMTTSTHGTMGNGKLAMIIGLMDTSLKFGVYFFHERMWNKIDYGREIPKKAGDFDI